MRRFYVISRQIVEAATLFPVPSGGHIITINPRRRRISGHRGPPSITRPSYLGSVSTIHSVRGAVFSPSCLRSESIFTVKVDHLIRWPPYHKFITLSLSGITSDARDSPHSGFQASGCGKSFLFSIGQRAPEADHRVTKARLEALISV